MCCLVVTSDPFNKKALTQTFSFIWLFFSFFFVAGAGVTSEGKEVYLCDIWPSREEVQQTEEDTVISSIFKDLRGRMEVRI